MNLELEGKKAIVCAASAGLGRAVAEALAAEGCQLVINGRDANRLEQVVKDIRRDHGVSVTGVPGSVNEKAIQDALFEAYSKPDILITNNGGPPFKPFEMLSEEDFLGGFRGNAITPIMMIQRAISGMRERGFGRIVNIASVTVVRRMEGLDVSAAARSGLVAGLRSAALDYAAANVTINTVLPGLIATQRMLDSIKYNTSQNASEDPMNIMQEKIPARRLGKPSELGALVTFLCGEQSGYITGQIIPMDGGISIG